MKNSQKGYVTQLLVLISALLVVGGGIYVYESKKIDIPDITDVQVQQSNQPQQTTGQNNSVNSDSQNTQTSPQINTSIWKKYSDDLISFEYPVLISSKQDEGTITLSHSVAYRHYNQCDDFKGDAPPLDRLSDFGVSLKVVNQNLKAFVQSSVYPGWDYVSKNPFKFGSLNGYRVSSGVEGCGEDIYFITISSTQTLVIHRGYVAEFNSINEDYQTYLNLPGIISPNKGEEYFNHILSTLKFISPNSNQPSVTVLYPNMGEVLNNGGRDNIATIRWTTSDFGSMNIMIGLLNKDGDWIKTIASDIPNTGNYNWRMDPTIASGEYKIAINSPQSMDNSATGPVASDLSDSTFVISTRSITSGKTFVTLVSPNGGEALTAGNKITIKWSSLGEKPNSAIISLRSNARCPYGYSCTPLPNSFTNIAEISGNDLDKGEYEWTVNKSDVDSHGNGYLIGIMIVEDNLGNANYDDSDSSFTIN
ncbi:MAG: Ser-Thr-rich GPI-anchored membrane family protein [Candidatus Paceibacterota bacterium]|jgi:hypothetical protein